jgi:hypothetical protein
MILHGDPQPVHATGAENLYRPLDDPRIEAMARLCRAIDERRHRDVIAIGREFRAMGLSICLIRPPGRGGA